MYPSIPDKPLLMSAMITVDQEGTVLSYKDSGVPSSHTRGHYITIFAIHGIIFAGRKPLVLVRCTPAEGLSTIGSCVRSGTRPKQ